MTRSPLPFKPLLAGLFLTLAQIAVAVFLLAPEGPLSYRYSTLIEHDSYWFMNIVDRGYATTVPPVDHKVMEVSNVAFFPAYPAIAALLRYGLNLDTENALLVTAQAAAWGFWSYFFLFCERWNLSPALQFFGALSIVAHPAAFFLIAGYSESLFLMALVGFIYWSSAEGTIRESLGRVARYGHVGDAHCGNCVRGFSGGTIGFCDRMDWFAHSLDVGSPARIGSWLDVCRGVGRHFVLRLLPTPVG